MPLDLSIVATLYRSSRHLEEFHRRITAEAERITSRFEIVLVNDGSPDDSLAVALALHARDPRVKVVDLSRNFGHHKAMMTGLAHTRGELVFLLDCDLEEAPELLGQFHQRRAAEGVDVVYGVQERRKGGWFERIAGDLFFRAFNAMSTHPIPHNVTTARLMTRRYVDRLLEHRERQMVISGLWVITGFEQRAVVIQKGSRAGSSYDLLRKVTLLVDAVTSFSDRPLVFIFYLGVLIVTLSGLAAAYLVVRRVFFGVLLAGWPSLIVSVWLLGGLTVFSIGVVGIYVSKVFIETKQRPYTVIRAIHDRTGEAA